MAAVFFGSDFANPDTYQKFWADMQMFTTTMTQPDPQTFMEQYCSWELAQKDNKWAKRNISRWRNDEYDKAWRAAESELDTLLLRPRLGLVFDLAQQLGEELGIPAANVRVLAPHVGGDARAGVGDHGAVGAVVAREAVADAILLGIDNPASLPPLNAQPDGSSAADWIKAGFQAAK